MLEFDQRIQANLRGREYFRYSSADALHAQIETLVQDGNLELVRVHLPIPAIHALVRLSEFRRREQLETARERGNSRFLRAQAGAVRTASSGVLDHTLTDEQAHAIATDEDVTLVLAGAGTGKTAVITGKIAYLVRHQEIDPKEILVLAFNRKAAAEIRDRLPSDLQGACVSTFHAFGMRTLGATSGRKPHVSILATDGAKLAQTIDGILKDLLTSKQHGEQLRNLLALHRNPYKSPFDFKTSSNYREYVRRCELRTLSGDLVNSLEEVQIANFLSMNGIKFKYEEPYPVNTANRRHRQYMPDFYLPEHKIYIEHFALNE
ncbi:MAG: UvrD-helicase domain-containing protein, partial [Candidatus Aminicenantes bacterium]|nr:UvrD-helicase domain-containing protein [Candidatus Aminicenantes bacterium]